jgi:hypothetical protein
MSDDNAPNSSDERSAEPGKETADDESGSGGDAGWLSGLDDYDLRARFAPGALAAVPAVAAGVAFGLSDNAVLTSIAGFVSFAVLSFVIGAIARSLGKPQQKRIFEERNGAPTTHALRLHSSEWPDAQRRNWRANATGATGKPLGDVDDDGEIEVVVEALREATRDTEAYRHLRAENTTFGFFRNLLGVRPLALGLAGLSLAASVVGAVTAIVMDDPSWGLGEQIVAGVVSLIALAFFAWFPTDDRVWTAGRSYAERLMVAADGLAAAQPAVQPGSSAPTEPGPTRDGS